MNIYVFMGAMEIKLFLEDSDICPDELSAVEVLGRATVNNTVRTVDENQLASAASPSQLPMPSFGSYSFEDPF